MSEPQSVPWKWVAVTTVGILVILLGGIFSYILSANSAQIAELKTMIRDQNNRIMVLTDRIANNKRRMAAMGATVSYNKRNMTAVRATLSHYRRLAKRAGYSFPAAKKIPAFKLHRFTRTNVPKKK